MSVGLIRWDRQYVCAEDVRVLGRTYPAGSDFPMRRLWRQALQLLRKGAVVERGPLPAAPSLLVTTSGAQDVPPPDAPGAVTIEPATDPAAPVFRIVHRGAGRYHVVDDQDQPQHEGTLTKAEAEALVAEAGETSSAGA